MVFDVADIVDGAVDRVDVPFQARTAACRSGRSTTRPFITEFEESTRLRVESVESEQEIRREEFDRIQGLGSLLTDHEVMGADSVEIPAHERFDLRVCSSDEVIR